MDRLVRTSAFSSAADAFVAVSLAGSLFFNVSVDAARPRIILYLVITMAPFAVVAPLIGPFVDRVRGGHRAVIVLACLGRAGLALALAFQLRSLALYPLTLSILVLNKTHSVAKSALIPRLVGDAERLVSANSVNSRVVAVAGAIGGGLAVGILNLASGQWVLFCAAALYASGIVAALMIPRPPRVVTPPLLRMIEDQELRSPSLLLGVSSMALLRGAVGYYMFFAAFTLKASGEATWVFGAAAVASGLGGFVATFIAPELRRILVEERMLELALLLPAFVALAVPKSLTGLAVVSVSAVLGLAAALGRQGFDSLVQRDAPDAERGRAFARFEARLQLTWVVGALLPVIYRPTVTLGLYLMAAALVFGAVGYGTTARAAVKRHWGELRGVVPAADRLGEDRGPFLAGQLLDTAWWLNGRGSRRQAVAVAAAALDVARRRAAGDVPLLTDALVSLEGLVQEAVGNGVELDAETVREALESAQVAVDASQRVTGD